MKQWQPARGVDGLWQPPPIPLGSKPPPAEFSADSLGSPPDGTPVSGRESADRPSIPQATTRRNYFARHWRGELPLGVSYWANGLLVGVLAGIATLAVLSIEVQPHPKLYSLATIVLLLAILPGLTIWQTVGIWRSASNHIARGGRPIWASLARIVVILGVLRFGVDFSLETLPASGEYWRILTGTDQLSGYRLRVLRDATELEISGPIGFGLTERVQEHLDSHPTIKIVHLNSVGGRVAEARALRQLIAMRGLTTYTATGCASACTLAYAGGKERLIDANAKLSFHKYSFPGVRGSDFSAEYAADKAYLRTRGIDPAFVERAFNVPSSEMWTPTHEELLRAHFVTQLAESGQVALSGITPKQIEGLEGELLKLSLFATLKRTDPELYSTFVSEMKEALLKGHSLADVRATFLPTLIKLRDSRLPFASNEAVADFNRLLIDQLQAIRRVNPSLCYQYSMVDDPAVAEKALALIPKALTDRQYDVMALVIGTGKGKANRPASKEAAEVELDKAIRALAADYGDDVRILADLGKTGMDEAKACNMIIAFYSEFMKIPVTRSGPLLRYLYANR